jgi:hypothetical protein
MASKKPLAVKSRPCCTSYFSPDIPALESVLPATLRPNWVSFVERDEVELAAPFTAPFTAPFATRFAASPGAR